MKNLILIISIAIITETGLYAQGSTDTPNVPDEYPISSPTHPQSTNENERQNPNTEDNLTKVKKLFSQIKSSSYNAPAENLYKLQYLIKELDAPKDICNVAEKLPKIANAIKVPPTGKSNKGLPKECFRIPKCPECNGSGRNTKKPGTGKCQDCNGTGLRRKVEDITVVNGKTIKTYKYADARFDSESAKNVFKDYLGKIGAWLALQ